EVAEQAADVAASAAPSSTIAAEPAPAAELPAEVPSAKAGESAVSQPCTVAAILKEILESSSPAVAPAVPAIAVPATAAPAGAAPPVAISSTATTIVHPAHDDRDDRPRPAPAPRRRMASPRDRGPGWAANRGPSSARTAGEDLRSRPVRHAQHQHEDS